MQSMFALLGWKPLSGKRVQPNAFAFPTKCQEYAVKHFLPSFSQTYPLEISSMHDNLCPKEVHVWQFFNIKWAEHYIENVKSLYDQ